MAKKMKKLLGIAMAAILCTASVVPALADESSTVVEVNEAGQTVTTTTNEAIIEGANGNVTVEVSVHENIVSDPADPVEYEFNETTTTTTVADANGKVTDTRVVVEGSEVTATEKEDNGDEAGQKEVTVQLKPGETTTATAGTSVTTGDPQKGEGDTVYNSTTTETVERTVEATTGEGEIKVETTGQGDFNPIQTDRDMVKVEENQLHTWNGTSYAQTAKINGNTLSTKPEEGGYDFLFVGQGQMSDFYVGTETLDEEGNQTGKGHTGALQFEIVQDPEIENNKLVNDMEKDRFTAYCCDVTTGATAGYWYKIDNLEDAGYYDEESASYIRTIASNGYWGTSDEPKEDGSYETGSLNKLKQEMKAALASGAIAKEFEYTYEENLGKPAAGYVLQEGEYIYRGFLCREVTTTIEITDEMIDAITPGQALAATQVAIWTHANDETEGDKIDYERLIISGYKNPTIPGKEDAAGANAVLSYLLGLDPTSKEESTEIIDRDSFIKEDSMSLTVGDKVADHANNKDDNKDNDVYETSINFALVVTPSQDNDDLVVQVVALNANGESYIAATGRIAGDSSNDEGFNEVTFNSESGEYSLKGLNLAENSNFSFDLKLTGTQYLEEGVYIFTSEVRNGAPSQTFVGMAEGDKEVNVSQSFDIVFDVDENDYTVVTRRWGSDTAAKKQTGSGSGSNNSPKVTLSISPAAAAAAEASDDELTILDEEVPLAAAPETGDNSIVYVLMSLISLCGIALLMMKKNAVREN